MTAELKAGLFVLAAIGALAFMTTRLTQNRYSFAGTKTYYTNVSDATGLLSKSKVKMAGLDVGQLKQMELVGKQARIQVEIAADLVIHTDASIAVKAIGFLGDKYLELSPGSDSKPVLAENGYIAEGTASGSIDQLTQKTAQLVDSLREISDLLKDALKGGPQAADGSRLDRILDNMERFSEGLADIDKLGDLIDQLSLTVGNLSTISGRVARGEGTIGKLLSDSQTIDKLNSTLSGVNKLVNKADKFQVMLDARAASLPTIGGSRGSFSVVLQPTYDKYYLFGLSTRPQGVTTIKRTTSTVNPDSGGNRTVVEERVNDQTGVGVDAQLAKRFGDAVFRLGLFESTAGAGVDYHLLEDTAKLTAEVYRFGRGGSPQVNVGAEMSVFRPFFLWGGGDYLSSQENRSFFLGAGLRLSADDIKGLVGAAVTSGGLK